jgi:NAD(P)-dependent dehydrogenase (short-subunit alcohol dehydrogenase family)
MSSKRFDSKVALVTGAGSGIGRECALAFGRDCAAVIVIDRDGGGIDDTLRQIHAEGGRCTGITADVADGAAVSRAFSQALSSYGHIDYAINNAGVAHNPAATADITPEEWSRVLQVNVTGVWLCLREELRHMESHGCGSIVNTASFAGLRTLAMHTAYVASKHAVVGLTKNAAVEYASKGIRINAVAPGGIATAMMEANLATVPAAQRDAALQGIAGLHPMGRVGSAREIADAMVFLCSDQSAFITGVCLSVDGGWAAS